MTEEKCELVLAEREDLRRDKFLMASHAEQAK